MSLPTIIGATGAFIILVLFTFEQAHKLNRDSLAYDSWNFIGAGLLLIYAIILSSIPFAILNGVWAVVSLRDIFSDLRRKRKK